MAERRKSRQDDAGPGSLPLRLKSAERRCAIPAAPADGSSFQLPSPGLPSLRAVASFPRDTFCAYETIIQRILPWHIQNSLRRAGLEGPAGVQALQRGRTRRR